AAATVAAAGRLLGRYHRAAVLAEMSAPENPSPGAELAARWGRLRARLVGQAVSLPGDDSRQIGESTPVLAELRGAVAQRMDAWVQGLAAFWASANPGSRIPEREMRGSGDIEWLWAHGDFTPYNLVYRDGAPVGLLDF